MKQHVNTYNCWKIKGRISRCNLLQPLPISSELSPQLSMPLHVTVTGTQRPLAHLNMSLQWSEIQCHTILYSTSQTYNVTSYTYHTIQSDVQHIRYCSIYIAQHSLLCSTVQNVSKHNKIQHSTVYTLNTMEQYSRETILLTETSALHRILIISYR